jgi:hypothetical protein
MPHMFVNRTRYHPGVVPVPWRHPGRGRHPPSRPLLLGLQRFSSWPPPGQRGPRHGRRWAEEADAPTQSENPLAMNATTFGNLAADLFHPLNDDHVFWEAANTVAYELGGFIFILGSIPFLPAYNQHLELGVYLFIVGSFLYLVVALHDCWEVLEAAQEAEDDDDVEEDDADADEADSSEAKSNVATEHAPDGKHFSRRTRYRLDLAASLIYVCGSILFIVGSVVFLPAVEHPKSGAVLFIVGSVLFAVGALINMVQIFESHDGAAASLTTALLANLTAAFYLIGSTMFGVASVPYLFDFEDTTDANLIYTFLGWNYILGSVAFTIGGTMNYLRARILLHDQIVVYLSRKRAKQQLHELHQQQKEQNYSSNHTWGANSSTPLYPVPQIAPASTSVTEEAHDTDGPETTPRVMWQDQLVVDDSNSSGIGVIGQETDRDHQQTMPLNQSAMPLLDIFQKDTAGAEHRDLKDETTRLLSGDSPFVSPRKMYGHEESTTLTSSTTTTSASEIG